MKLQIEDAGGLRSQAQSAQLLAELLERSGGHVPALQGWCPTASEAIAWAATANQLAVLRLPPTPRPAQLELVGEGAEEQGGVVLETLAARGIRATVSLTFEEEEPASPTRVSYSLTRILETKQSEHHQILLFETRGLGKVLALDGIVQLTELDGYAYHEVLAHPALCAHPAPERVAIVGGGDGHLLVEVLKHPQVRRVDLLELDSSVLEVCRRHFGHVDAALRDERVHLRMGDAFESISEFDGALDVILCDLTDPIGEAARLFEEPFYRRCRRALRDPGMMVAQIESIHLHSSTVVGCRQALAQHFARTDLLWTAMATYPGAWWTFGAGTTGFDPRQPHRRPELRTRLYHPDAHAWFFIPWTVQEKLLP
jgi:spermidine synthase